MSLSVCMCVENVLGGRCYRCDDAAKMFTFFKRRCIMKMKWLLMLLAAAAALFTLSATSQAAVTDLFSVNFYAYNGSPDPQENVTLEAEQSAGMGIWETTGWENYLVPWNPAAGTQDPVTITSVQGATATFTLIDVRNGGGSQTVSGVRTLPYGDGNGDLMDAAAWGTLVPTDPGKIFDITVSDIPYDAYDVIVYLGAHPGVGGDGTGKITFNGVATDFTTGVFNGTFTEIVNSGDTGNYIVYEAVTDSSFSVQVWGTGNDGYNHIGAHGFQFRVPGVRNPSPANGAKVPIGDVDLSWTNMDPNSPGDDVYVDVWFGTEPNELDPGYDMTKVVTAGENTTTWTVSAATEGTYYWQVNSHIYGADLINEPNAIEGPLWNFIAVDDVPPAVDAGVDMITWSGQGVPLDPTVVDDGKSDLTYLWTVEPVEGITVAFDPSAVVEDPTVTMTKVPFFVPAIFNAGFEAVQLGEDGWGNIPGWTIVGRGGNWNPPEEGENIAYTSGVPEGNMCAWAEKEATLAQVLNETLVAADTQYELTVEVGNSLRYDWCSYEVQLLAGGNLLDRDGNSLTIPVDTWATSTIVHTSGGESDPNIGLPLEIRLLNKGGPIDYAEINFDDVQLLIDGEPAGGYVYDPEPSTVSMTLAVNDENNPTPVEDTMEIDVYEDACKAAIDGGVATYDETDFDNNCITDLKDLGVLLAEWLVDNALTAPIPK
jgi:hypothetical protein